MNRRTLLRTVPLLGVAASGCLRAPRNGGDDGRPRVTDRSLRDTGRCEEPETASVAVSDSDVRVTGCVTGPNGCAKADLGSASVDGSTLEVVVTTVRDAPPDAACTEALVYRGYVATVEVAGGPLETVRVVHDVPGGRQTVVETPA
jgi:hypothetical protein